MKKTVGIDAPRAGRPLSKALIGSPTTGAATNATCSTATMPDCWRTTLPAMTGCRSTTITVFGDVADRRVSHSTILRLTAI
jgi:hypothetical protein